MSSWWCGKGGAEKRWCRDGFEGDEDEEGDEDDEAGLARLSRRGGGEFKVAGRWWRTEELGLGFCGVGLGKMNIFFLKGLGYGIVEDFFSEIEVTRSPQDLSSLQKYLTHY